MHSWCLLRDAQSNHTFCFPYKVVFVDTASFKYCCDWIEVLLVHWSYWKFYQRVRILIRNKSGFVQLLNVLCFVKLNYTGFIFTSVYYECSFMRINSWICSKRLSVWCIKLKSMVEEFSEQIFTWNHWITHTTQLNCFPRQMEILWYFEGGFQQGININGWSDAM